MDENSVTVVVADAIHFRKAFGVGTEVEVQTLANRHYESLCPRCRPPQDYIEFEYEGKVLDRDAVVEYTVLHNGDCVDARFKGEGQTMRYEQACSGASQSPAGLHYLPGRALTEYPDFQEPKWITVKLAYDFGLGMAVTVKENMDVSEIMDAFAKLPRKDRDEMLVQRGGEDMVPEELLYCMGVQDGDVLRVTYISAE